MTALLNLSLVSSIEKSSVPFPISYDLEFLVVVFPFAVAFSNIHNELSLLLVGIYCYLQVSQKVPSQSAVHVHTPVPATIEHTPEFLQGLGVQLKAPGNKEKRSALNC